MLVAVLLVGTVCAATALAGGGSSLGKPHFHASGLSGDGPVAVADLNGDGRKDIVTGSSSSGLEDGIAVLDGAKHGFKPAKTYGVATEPSSLAIGDVNRDGRPDIAFSTYAGPPGVLLAKRHGGFGQPAYVPASEGTGAVRVADVNRDHKLDLLTADSSSVLVYLGFGNGEFGAPHDVTLPVEGEPAGFVVTKIDGDENPDLAVLVNAPGTGAVVSPLLGNGHGSFTGGTSRIVTASHVFGMAAGHFNDDKRLDLAVDYCGSVWVLMGTKSGFKAPDHYENSGNSCSIGPAVGDLNGDGHADLATTNEAADGNEVSVMLGKGERQARAFSPLPGARSRASSRGTSRLPTSTRRARRRRRSPGIPARSRASGSSTARRGS